MDFDNKDVYDTIFAIEDYKNALTHCADRNKWMI